MALTPLNEIPSPADCGAKDIYAFYGLACYTAQVLEKGLLNMVVAFCSQGVDVSQAECEAIFKKHERNTLGQLLVRARKVVPIPEEMAAQLDIALEERNWMTHQFFWDHAAAFMTEQGRASMINSLQNLVRLFQTTDRLVEALCEPIFQKSGLTQKQIEDYQNELIDKYIKETGASNNTRWTP